MAFIIPSSQDEPCPCLCRPLRLLVEAIASRDVKLLVLNPIALRLQQTLHNDGAKVAGIEKMVIEDQALSSQILRVANAAFYRGLQPNSQGDCPAGRRTGRQSGDDRVDAAALPENQQPVHGVSGKVVATRLRKWKSCLEDSGAMVQQI